MADAHDLGGVGSGGGESPRPVIRTHPLPKETDSSGLAKTQDGQRHGRLIITQTLIRE